MVTSLSRKAKLTMVLMGSLCALALGLISGPAPAQAGWSNYCVGWLPGNTPCNGAARWLYQTYGWGDQYPVCVAVAAGELAACSAGAGQGVYSPRAFTNVWAAPWIRTVNTPPNFVHGVALQP